MRQDALVIRKLSNGMAEVAVTRGTACGSNCGNCESCIYSSELRAIAVNKINADVGQHVVLESKSSTIYKAEFFVYILPLLLMVFCYALSYKLGASEAVCIFSSFVALAVSALILVLTQKNKKNIQHTIVKLKEN